MNVRPHVAQNTNGRRSAIMAHDAPCRLRDRPAHRKRIEEAFGWMKSVAGQRKTRFRGVERVGWSFAFAATAYNLVRLPKLLAAPSTSAPRPAGGSSSPIFEPTSAVSHDHHWPKGGARHIAIEQIQMASRSEGRPFFSSLLNLNLKQPKRSVRWKSCEPVAQLT